MDIKLFAGFWPAMTIQQARKAIGPETSDSTSQFGRYWLYERPKGTIRISLEDYSSFFLPVGRAWELKGIPLDQRVGAVFDPEIVSKIPPGLTDYEAFVLTQCGQSAIQVIVEGGKVIRVNWLRSPGSMPLPEKKRR